MPLTIRVNFPINFQRDNFLPSRVSDRRKTCFFFHWRGEEKNNNNDYDTLTSRKEDPRDRKHGSTGLVLFIEEAPGSIEEFRSLIYILDEKSSFASCGKFSNRRAAVPPGKSGACTTYFILLSYKILLPKISSRVE